MQSPTGGYRSARRTVLGGLGAVITASLAGCAGGASQEPDPAPPNGTAPEPDQPDHEADEEPAEDTKYSDEALEIFGEDVLRGLEDVTVEDIEGKGEVLEGTGIRGAQYTRLTSLEHNLEESRDQVADARDTYEEALNEIGVEDRTEIDNPLQLAELFNEYSYKRTRELGEEAGRDRGLGVSDFTGLSGIELSYLLKEDRNDVGEVGIDFHMSGLANPKLEHSSLILFTPEGTGLADGTFDAATTLSNGPVEHLWYTAEDNPQTFGSAIDDLIRGFIAGVSPDYEQAAEEADSEQERENLRESNITTVVEDDSLRDLQDYLFNRTNWEGENARETFRDRETAQIAFNSTILANYLDGTSWQDGYRIKTDEEDLSELAETMEEDYGGDYSVAEMLDEMAEKDLVEEAHYNGEEEWAKETNDLKLP